ncbi:MAG: BrnA antitoxin family protein [Chloroflexi bacterium]|nr:BrnA antitoxin family protein [Chloroflexota bacterium]
MNSESKTDWQYVDSLTDSEIDAAIPTDADAAPIADIEDFERARPVAEVVPRVVEWRRRGRGPQKKPIKVPVSIRLSPEVIVYFQSQGKGWQSRMDEVLQEYVASHN